MFLCSGVFKKLKLRICNFLDIYSTCTQSSTINSNKLKLTKTLKAIK